jgi:hypothetical protein
MERPGRRDEFEHSLWGAGLEAAFPEGRPTSMVPWQQAAGSKSREGYDKELVRKTLSTPPERLDDIDPRNLRATQPRVTRAGVEYYMGDRYQKTGETFADKGNAGNQWPVVYRRPTMADPEQQEDVLLSGHHRAAAALLQGNQFQGRRIEGPWGSRRKKP